MSKNDSFSSKEDCDYRDHVVDEIYDLSTVKPSFNDLDFNLISVLTSFLHSSFEPLVFIDKEHKIESEKVDLYTLFSLNRHYRKYRCGCRTI
jgi:hypothetical protein